MRQVIRNFVLLSLVLAGGIVPVTSFAVPIEEMSRILTGAAQPIEISGKLSSSLREALGAVVSGQYDDAIAQTTKIIVDRPQNEAAAAYEIRAVALFLKGDSEAAITALKRSIEADSSRSSAFTKLGSIEIDTGSLDDARKHLQRAVELNGRDTFAHQRLAALLERQGDRAGAIREYTAVIEGKPANDTNIRLELARLYSLDRRFGDVIALLEPMLISEPGNTQAALMLGGAYLGQGDAGRAVTLLRAALTKATKDAGLAVAVGIAERAAGQFDASLASLQQALEIKPNWAAAYYQIGLTYVVQKKFTQAQTAFEKAQSLVSNPAAIARDLAAMLTFGGRPQQVIDALRTLYSRDTARPSDFIALATAYQASGQTSDAEQTYRDAIKRFAKDQAAYVQLGAMLSQERKYDDALKVLTDGNTIAPDDPRLLRDTAIVQAELKRYPDALATAEKLVSLDRKDPDRSFLLASLYEASGDTVQAKQTYQAILTDNPNHALTLNNLASLMTSGGDPQAAIPLARRAVALVPLSPVIQDTLGWALLKAGQATEAVKVLEKARELAPADPEASYRLAVAQKAAGDRRAARLSLRNALAVSTSFKDADAARTLLAEPPQ